MDDEATKGTGYAPAPKPGERYWAETLGGDTVFIEICSVELVFRTGWVVWGRRPSRDDLLPLKCFIRRKAQTA